VRWRGFRRFPNAQNDPRRSRVPPIRVAIATARNEVRRLGICHLLQTLSSGVYSAGIGRNQAVEWRRARGGDMQTNVVTRWEDWRDLRGGNPRHRRAVDEWLKTHPAVLYWGDSWFSTPLYPNLARQSAARIEGLRMIVGKPGATAAQLLAANQVSSMVERIANNPFDTLCVSAGGNDALADRLATVYAPWMKTNRPRITADQAFAMLVAAKVFVRIADRYRLLLDTLLAKVVKKRKDFRVIGHGYAPLCRIGVSGDLSIGNIGLIAILKDDVGPWLWGPMKRVLTDIAEGARFAQLLLVNGFRDQVLKTLEQEYAGLFSYADLASILPLSDPALWYDEIHPKESGFALCAPVLNDAIRMSLPAAKRAAVR
jgi:hypothetical protein